MKIIPNKISNCELWAILGLTLGTTAGSFLFSYLAYIVHQDKNPSSFWALWGHWDTGHFLNIVRNGYSESGPSRVQIVFFPLYPYLVRALTSVISDPIAAALYLSNLCYFACCVLLYQIVRLESSPETSLRTVFLFSVFPTAYFLHAGYSESLFLMLAMGSLYCARLSRWGGAASLAALCTFTRITGLALLPALAIEYLHQRLERRQELFEPRAAWLALAPSGFIAYLGMNWSLYGNPLQFLEFQRTEWFKQPGPAWKGLLTAWNWGFTQTPRTAVLNGGAEWVFALLALLLCFVALFRTRLSYGAFALTSWFLVTSTSFWQSEPRYVLSMFPIFIALAHITRPTAIFYVVSFTSVLFYALFLGQFVQGSWAF